ncbi:unnamed protein product [Blepharisma stoltei]|uniref:E3 ubiquitin-protein ligase n=1 Tax=Blepharisma stoltei TaxID=1481888 RepID=A0AAU9K505_9CILI|nr:unnamed protein product [Blepharisma stoltei]
MVCYKGNGVKVKLKLINPLLFIDNSDFFLAFSSFSNPSLLAKQLSNKKKFIISRSESGYNIVQNRIVLINLDKSPQEAFYEVFQIIVNAEPSQEGNKKIKRILLAFPENPDLWLYAIEEVIKALLNSSGIRVSLTICLKSQELEIIKSHLRDSNFHTELNVNNVKRLRRYFFSRFICQSCSEFAYKPYVSRCCYSIYCNSCVKNLYCKVCNNRCEFEINLAIKKLVNESPYYCNCGESIKVKDIENHMLSCAASLFRCKFIGCSFEGSQIELMDHVFQFHTETILERMNEYAEIDISQKQRLIQCRMCGDFSESQCKNCLKSLPIAKKL